MMRKKMTLLIIMLAFEVTMQSQTVILTTDFTLDNYVQNVALQVAPIESLPIAGFAKYAYENNNNLVSPQIKFALHSEVVEVGVKYFMLTRNRLKKIYPAGDLRPNSGCPEKNFKPYKKIVLAKFKDGFYLGASYLRRHSDVKIAVSGDLMNIYHSYMLDFQGINVSTGIEHHVGHLSIGITAQYAVLQVANSAAAKAIGVSVRQADIFGYHQTFRLEPSYKFTIGVNF